MCVCREHMVLLIQFNQFFYQVYRLELFYESHDSYIMSKTLLRKRYLFRNQRQWLVHKHNERKITYSSEVRHLQCENNFKWIFVFNLNQ